MNPTHYDLLGVTPDATPQQIKAAYRSLARLFHPDRLPQGKLSPALHAFAEERLKALNEAYHVLGDPDRRAAYDASLSRGRPATTAATTGRGPAGPQPAAAANSAASAAVQEQLWLGDQIADLERSLRQLTAERDRVHAELNQAHTRTWRRFGLLAGLTGLGSWLLMLAALGLSALPPEALGSLGRVVIFTLLTWAYEYAAALLIALGCTPPREPGEGSRLELGDVGRAALRGLPAGLVVGAAGWVVWRVLFYEANRLPALLALAVVFLAGHLAFCWVALGPLALAAREQLRLYDRANAPILRLYRSHLDVLHSRRQAARARGF